MLLLLLLAAASCARTFEPAAIWFFITCDCETLVGEATEILDLTFLGLIGAAALTGEGGGEATIFFGDELTKGEDTILVGDMGSIGGAMVKFNLQRIRAI